MSMSLSFPCISLSLLLLSRYRQKVFGPRSRGRENPGGGRGGEEEEAAKSQNFMVRRSQKVEQDPFDADGQQLNKK